MNEIEITANITKETFDRYLERFTEELGAPQLKRRITFIILERGKGLDNRIKITNGEAKIVQEVRNPPNKQGQRTSEEIEIDIPNTFKDVKNSIRLLENFYRDSTGDVLKLIVQHENYIWETENYEFKLTRQFGKQDLFLYEIETFCDKSPLEFQHELRVKPDFDSFSEERKELRIKHGDIHFENLSKVEFDALIVKYLQYK